MRTPEVGDSIYVNFENHQMSGEVVELDDVWIDNSKHRVAMLEAAHGGTSWVNLTKAQSILFAGSKEPPY